MNSGQGIEGGQIVAPSAVGCAAVDPSVGDYPTEAALAELLFATGDWDGQRVANLLGVFEMFEGAGLFKADDVEALDQEKLSLLLKLKYANSMADAFAGFQWYLYDDRAG